MTRFGKTGIAAGLQNFAFFRLAKTKLERAKDARVETALEATPASCFSLLSLKKSEKIILFCRPAWQGKCYRNGEVNSGAREREEGLKFLHFYTLPRPVY